MTSKSTSGPMVTGSNVTTSDFEFVRPIGGGASGQCYIVRPVNSHDESRKEDGKESGSISGDSPANSDIDDVQSNGLVDLKLEEEEENDPKLVNNDEIQESVGSEEDLSKDEDIPSRTETSNSLYVMKIIDVSDLSKDERGNCDQEAKVLADLHHPNIIGYKGHFFEDDKLCILTDYADGGDLGILVEESKRPFSEEKIADVFMQIVLAMKYIHSRSIVHRDIKPANIYTTKRGIVRLGDFGVAKVNLDPLDLMHTVAGTPNCLAPELWEGKPYSSKCDIWSLGCVLVELACRRPAFSGKSLPAMMMNILEKEYRDVPVSYSTELRDLASQLLQKNPDDRPSIKEVYETQFVRQAVQRFVEAKEQFEYKLKSKSNDTNPMDSVVDEVFVPWTKRMDQQSPAEKLAREVSHQKLQDRREKEKVGLRKHSKYYKRRLDDVRSKVSLQSKPFAVIREEKPLEEERKSPDKNEIKKIVLDGDNDDGISVELVVKADDDLEKRRELARLREEREREEREEREREEREEREREEREERKEPDSADISSIPYGGDISPEPVKSLMAPIHQIDPLRESDDHMLEMHIEELNTQCIDLWGDSPLLIAARARLEWRMKKAIQLLEIPPPDTTQLLEFLTHYDPQMEEDNTPIPILLPWWWRDKSHDHALLAVEVLCQLIRCERILSR